MKILDISTISTAEYALINATWLTLTNIEFQCSQIEEGYRKRKDADTVIKYRRIERGCGVIADKPRIEIDNIEYYSCLCHESFKDHTLDNTIWLHDQYKKGHLAYPGCLLDQPAKYIELMRLMDRLFGEREQELNKEANNGK